MPESLVLQFLDKSKHCTSFEELSSLVETTLAELGFNKWGYEAPPVNPFDKGPPTIVHNFPQEWIDHYLDSGYYEIDPVLTIGKEGDLPFQWSKLLHPTQTTRELIEYQDEADSFGLTDGLGIPIPRIHGKKSMFSITGNDSPKDLADIIKHHQSDLIAIACVYHSLASDFLKTEELSKNADVLTEREKECILWIMNGLSNKEIARKLGISPATVAFHNENSKRKLNVTNKYHMVVEAIMKGYIQP